MQGVSAYNILAHMGEYKAGHLAALVVAVIILAYAVQQYRKKHPPLPKNRFVDWTGGYSGMEWPSYPTYPPFADLKNAYMN